jgi:hypothetical protein
MSIGRRGCQRFPYASNHYAHLGLVAGMLSDGIMRNAYRDVDVDWLLFGRLEWNSAPGASFDVDFTQLVVSVGIGHMGSAEQCMQEKLPATEQRQDPEYKIEFHQFMLRSFEVSFSMSSPDHAHVCQFMKIDCSRSIHDKSLAPTLFISFLIPPSLQLLPAHLVCSSVSP